jgi:uncharacterized protein
MEHLFGAPVAISFWRRVHLLLLRNEPIYMRLTKHQARRVILAHQGLWPPYDLSGKEGVLDYISRVGCIQFDPLNIVGRNPELVLQARVVDFRPSMLRELLYENRRLLDGWDKMMSIYPVDDWPYFHRHRQSALREYGASSRPATSILPQIREAISERGPLSSIDLDFDQPVDWPWAPTRMARAALESMYWWGELVVHHKVNTRKYYDFASRHIPAGLLNAPDPYEADEQYQDWHILRRLGGVGLLWGRSGSAWLSIPGVKSRQRGVVLKRLTEQRKVVEVSVEGMNVPLYMRAQDRARLDQVLSLDVPSPRAAIIAPLDNLLWDRGFVEELFDFEYRWEVYKPVAERRWGYYVLPILYGDQFIARFEPGRDKKSGVLIIKNWWWEPDVKPSNQMRSDLRCCFQRFLGFLGADRVQFVDEVVERAGLDWLRATMICDEGADGS